MEFPVLKTGVVAQYPLQRSLRTRSSVVHFADGSEQRFTDTPAPLHAWTVQLDLIDDSEVADLEAFFLALAGRFGTFSFCDPTDGSVYPNCSLDDDSLTVVWTGEMRASTKITIRENRG